MSDADQKIKISIIIPCYNTEQSFFQKCIESISRQIMKNIEIIVVDDGSDKDYREIYKTFSDPRIKIYYQENSGVSAARNNGLKYASGDYVMFVDSDDILAEDYLEEALRIAEAHQADLVIGCNVHMDQYDCSRKIMISDNDIEVYKNENIRKLKAFMVGKLRRFDDGKLYIGRGPWNRLVKRELALDVLFDKNLVIFEDILWNLQLLRKCNTVCCVKKAWYLYNVDTGLATKKYKPNAVIDAEVGLKRIRMELDFENDDEFRAFYDRCFEDMERICQNTLQSNKPEFFKVRKMFYTREPWKNVTCAKYWDLSNCKSKVKILLFKFRVLLDIFALKGILRQVWKRI